jgi:hypothetical protein
VPRLITGWLGTPSKHNTHKKKKQTNRVIQQASGLFGFPNIPKW